MTRLASYVFAATALVAGVLFYQKLNENAAVDAFPAFTLPSLHGGEMLSQKDLPQSPHVINFWASWCVSCLGEHPLLMALKQDGISVVGVNFQDRGEAARGWLEQHGDPYTAIIQDRDGFFATTSLDIRYLPHTLFVDGEGVIFKHVHGTLKPEHLTHIQDRR